MVPFGQNIAPAPPSAKREDTQTSSSNTQPPPRKNVTNACLLCQKRKRKCDGKQPCQGCEQAGSECTYVGEDHRRKNIVKRKYEEFQRDHELLNTLLETIRGSRDEQVSQIVSLIRSNAPFEEVKACMSTQLDHLRATKREPTPEWQDFRKEYDELEHSRSTSSPDSTTNRKRKNVMSVTRITDEPLYRMRAGPWTSVTDDDDLVSNLISLWLTWDKPFYNWLDTSLFLRDMQAENTKSMFCSPFLVNCILAVACPYSDYTEARTEDGKISELMEAFIEEAKRLLETEKERTASPTLTQGLMTLQIAVTLVGQDKLGYDYMLQATSCCEELVRSGSRVVAAYGSQDFARELSISIDKTCWGVFHITTCTSLSWMRPQKMEAPQRDKPAQLAVPDCRQEWKPYPLSGPSRPWYQDDMLENFCHVAVIGATLSTLLFDGPLSGKEGRISDLYAQLLDRQAALPDELRPRKDCEASILVYHAWVQAIILRMFLPLRKQMETTSSPAMRQQARDICISAVLEVASICKLHMQSYGCSIMNVSFTQSTSLALFAILEESDITSFHPQIIDLCICLRAQTRRWPLAMGVMRMVQVTARKSDLVLPPETDKLFGEFESSWEQNETLRFSSIFPDPAASTSSFPGIAPSNDMSGFLNNMSQMHLEEEG